MTEKKTLNVLLVSPKSYEEREDDPCPEAQRLLAYSFYPYSVVYLVNYLRKFKVCQADFIDLAVESREDLFRRIETESFDLIGFTSSTQARFGNLKLIREVKRRSPSSRIVVGGHFFSSTAAEALQHAPEIDFVVRGEGEETLAELVAVLSAGQDEFSAIAGLSYRKDGTVVRNPARKAPADLTPFEIEYPLVQKPGYSLLVPMRNWEEDPGKQAFPAMLGRGCNNRCIFCIHRHFPYRRARIDSALRQIAWARENLGARHFMFTDPSFCEDRTFVEEFCDTLIAQGAGIEWYCEGRADIPLPLLTRMRQAGCISIDFALESGSPRVLEAIRKDTDPDMVLQFAAGCRSLGIRASYFTMVSLPEERVEDFEKTLELIGAISQLGFYTSPAPLGIYPGTVLEKQAREKGLLAPGFSWYDETYHCSLSFVNPRENRVPHYLEHLTEAEVGMFQRMAATVQGLGATLQHFADPAGRPPPLQNPYALKLALASVLADGHRRIVIAGAGSAAKELLALAAARGLEVECLTDRDPRLHGTRVADVPVRSLGDGLATGLPVLVGSCDFTEEILEDIRAASLAMGLPAARPYAPAFAPRRLPAATVAEDHP